MTPYITSIERIGRKEGREEGHKEGGREGHREMIGEIVKARFGACPPELDDRLKEIEDLGRLKELHLRAIRCEDLQAFIDEAAESLLLDCTKRQGR